MKKVMKATAIAAAVLGIAASAQAADFEINIMGASAQSKFWNTNGQVWMADAVNGMGCTSVSVLGDQDNGATVGSNCTPSDINITLAPTDRVILRYQAKASIWGPMSAKSEPIPGNPCANGFWPMIDVDNPAGPAVCVNITYGASDVSGEAFVQSSEGWIFGPNSDFTNRTIGVVSDTDDYYDAGENVYTGFDTTGLGNVRPVVVPFAFFATEDVQNFDADTDKSNDGLTRLQAVLAFSGQATNWEDIGIDANNDPNTDTKMTVCLRHAGSGTHATLDHAIAHGDATILTKEDILGTNGPIVWFNEGSSDLARCMSYGGTGFGQYPTATSYAIGYADADKCGDSYDRATSTSWSSKCYDGGQDIRRLNYQGLAPTRENIRDCKYPYFAEQYLYYLPSEVDPKKTSGADNDDLIHKNLYDFMANYDGSAFWANANEMKCTKDTDFDFPRKK